MAVCLALLMLLCLPPVHAGQPGVLVVNGSRDDIYAPFIEAFEQDFATPSGNTADTTIEQLMLEDTDSSAGIRKSPAGIIVSVGTRAARSIAALGLTTPVLYALIPESTYLSVAPVQTDCATHAAIYIDQPLDRQTRLAGMVFPEARSYGALLGPTSRRHLPALEKIAAGADWELVVNEVQQDMEPEWTTRRLVEKTDLILAISDPKTLNRNNAKWLLYTAYQEQNPVIGFSSAYVRAGAAAAVYSEPGQLGRQAAEFVQRWQQDGAGCLPPAEYPAYFSVATNPAIIHSLGGTNRDDDELARLLAGKERAPR
jgi:ABC-type uncharacterized transport system substrate-binding protein